MKYFVNTDKLALLPSTTANLEVWVDFMEATLASGVIQDNTFKPLNQRTLFSSAVEADILTAPGAATIVRQLQHVGVKNVHATAANTVQLKQYLAGSATALGPAVTLQAGEYLIVNEAGVLFVYDTNGGVKTASATGRWLKTTILTAGTSFTTQMAATAMFVRMVAGGGGGGGVAANAAGNGTVGGGGSAGGYAEKTFVVTPNTAYAYAIGAAGAAGASAGGTGGTGGDTTITVGATTVTTKGGLGGTFLATGTVAAYALGGAPPAVSTNGDVNSSGEAGRCGGLIAAGAGGASGGGGSGQFGAGGAERKTSGAGSVGIGFGAGGSGALSLASGAAAAGGAGTAGLICIDEYA